MRKWIVGLLILLAVVIGGIYIFIPAQLTITKIVPVSSTANGTYAFLADQKKWSLWWPSKNIQQNGSFSYNGYTYQVNQQMNNVVTVAVMRDNEVIADTIIIVPINKDSVYVKWTSILLTGSNPLKKIQRYQQAARLKKNLDNIAVSLRNFLEKNENVYGTHIIKTKVKDTLLIATKASFTAYPTTADIYQLINRLKTYAQQQGAKETGYPMLNILQGSNSQYETMVALPIDKAIKEEKNIYLKQMVPGNILVTETTGGPYIVNKTFRQLENYVNDYKMESPAIPFQSLITDRMAEPDTSKWVTKLYYPVY